MKFLLTFLFCTIVTLADAQSSDTVKPDQIRAIHLTMEDGLSSNGLNVMIRDVNGFLWAGSAIGGLCRYDGAIFKKYFPDPQKRGAIHSDRVNSMVEDIHHNIWLGTTKGLARYDVKADTFTNFITSIDSNNAIRSVYVFWSTGTRVYCIESEKRVVTYDINSYEKKTVLSFNDPTYIRYSILDTASNSLWMLQPDPNNSVGEGLLQVSLQDGKKQLYTWPCYRNITGHSHFTEAMKLDSKRNVIWINSPDGLLAFSLKDKKFDLVDAFKEMITNKEYTRFVGIDVDLFGRVWLATSPYGILRYDPDLKLLQPIFSDTNLQRLAGNANYHIYCDREGIVWVSNWLDFGIYEILPYQSPFQRFMANSTKKYSLSNLSIFSIIPGSNHQLYIGTRDGLNIFNVKTEQFRVLRKEDLPGIRGNFIVPVHLDTLNGKVWVRSTESTGDEWRMNLYEMDLNTGISNPIVFRDRSKSLDNNSISSASEWFWPYKKGLLIGDELHGIFELKEKSLVANLLIPFKIVLSRMVLHEDRYIFLINPIDGTRFSFENKEGVWLRSAHLLDSLEWINIFQNKKDQSYWVSFRYELWHCDKNFNIIRVYKQEDGYQGAAFAMVFDNQGNLWFTDILDQICRLNPMMGTITILGEEDGYFKQNMDWYGTAAKDEDGNLYFGALNRGKLSGGMDRIQPDKYSSEQTSAVYFRSLLVNQQSYPLAVGINNLEELTLNYDENTFSLEAGIIDFYAQGKGRIRYKLEGEKHIEDWQYGPAYYTIRYDGLSPGHYRLNLQASNAKNEFNSPLKLLSIYIRAPFWETWWFRILAALAAAGLILGVIQIRSSNLKQRNKQLEAKVELRTNELKESLKELKETQAQLIQREKMASLGELTAGIAHEIQNPLNFVNNFSEINMELLNEIEGERRNTTRPDNFRETGSEEEKGENQPVPIIFGGPDRTGDELAESEILSTIKENQQKIIHHGKRADAIVKSMLQHSRSSETSIGIKEPTDINALAEEYLRLAYHGLRAKDKSFNSEYKMDLDPALPMVNVISQDIGRVFLNLFNNAFWAVNERSRQGGASFRGIGTPPVFEEYYPSVNLFTKKLTDYIEIRIHDNGPGIPSSIIEKIFQPFFTTKPSGEGTGLGLSLAYDIITKVHGGELTVESEVDQYTRFIIRLPLK